MDYSFTGTSARAETRLREIFVQIYAWMTAGLLVTGAVAAFTARTPALVNLIFGNMLVFWGLFILQIAIVVGLSAAINRLSTAMALGLFILYAALNGLTLSVIFLAYTQASIASTFFITAGMFGALSAFGMITKRDLSQVGSIAFMALIGILLASVVNIFLHSTALGWVISYVGVLIFVALTASDTQKLKRLAEQTSEEGIGRVAVLGALTLYLDFINLFLFLLRIMGRRN